MADKTISALSSLDAATADGTADEVPVADTSIPEAKKITPVALVQAGLRDGPLIAQLDLDGNDLVGVAQLVVDDIAVSGTVDGRDVSADGAALDALAAGAVLADGSVPMTGDLDLGGNSLVNVGGGAGGDVVGPAGATDNAVARYDGATGKLIQNSAVTIDDSGNLSLPSAAEVYASAGGEGWAITTPGAGQIQISAFEEGGEESIIIDHNQGGFPVLRPASDSQWDWGSTAVRWRDGFLDALTLTSTLALGAASQLLATVNSLRFDPGATGGASKVDSYLRAQSGIAVTTTNDGRPGADLYVESGAGSDGGGTGDTDGGKGGDLYVRAKPAGAASGEGGVQNASGNVIVDAGPRAHPVDDTGALITIGATGAEEVRLGRATKRVYVDGAAIQAPDGAVGAPSVAVGVAGVGIFRPTGFILGLAANSEAIYVENTGARTALRGDVNDAWQLGDTGLRFSESHVTTRYDAAGRQVGAPTVESTASTALAPADTDHGKVVRCTAGTTVTVTANSGRTAGTTVEYVQEGAGQVQVVGSGVTLRYPAAFNPYTAQQWSSLVLTWLDTDEVLVRGDLAAA